MQYVYAFVLFLAYLLRKMVCIHSQNVNNRINTALALLSHQWSKVYSQWTIIVHA